jgi:hypothetical protein
VRASEFTQNLVESELSYIGNCTDDDVIEHIFGDATRFAQLVDEHGDDFELDDLVVKYDPESDIHSFYYKQTSVTESSNEKDSLDDIVSAFVSHYKDDPMGMFMHAKSSYLDAVSSAKNFSMKAAELNKSHQGMTKQEFQDTVIKHFGPHLKNHDFPKHASEGWGAAEQDMMKSLTQGVTEDIVDEMALQTYKTMGDFSKPGPFKDPDYKLVTHPVHIQKVTDFFQQVPQDFRFFMSNLPGMRKYQESGEKTPQEIQQIFGEKIAREILQDTEDAITVIYIGNYGQNKVMMSPHTMAHRVGHAITATGRYDRSKVIPEWTELFNHFFNQLKKIVKDCYQRPESNRYDYFTSIQQRADMEAKYMALIYQIGTLKSSRERNLNSTYEFLYEMLAQYIRTGRVTLNPLPISAGYGRLVGWKTKSFQKYIRINSECSDELYRTEVTQRLAIDMGILFKNLLDSCVGKVFVM